MLCHNSLRFIPLLVLSACFFLSLDALAVKINPQTNQPYLDTELLDLLRLGVGGEATLVVKKRGLGITSLDAMENLFDELNGVDDIVISAYDNDVRLVVLNPWARMSLSEMKLTYQIAIQPCRDGICVKGKFQRENIKADVVGVIDEVVAVNDFYEEGIVHYTVTLSYMGAEALFTVSVG